MLIGPIQISSRQPEFIHIPPEWGPIPKIAIHVIRTVGLFLMSSSVGCFMVGLQVPGIALFVAGAAALILGFALDRRNEINKVGVPSPSASFGKEEWIQYIGDPGETPLLPANIDDILAKPCPFWEGQTIAQTHILVLIPKTVTRVVNGKTVTVPLTLKTLGGLVESSNDGTGVGYSQIWQEILQNHGNTPVAESHWVLITKDVLPGSRNKDYATQKLRVEVAGYEVPSCLEAATAILLEHVRSEMRLFVDFPITYTRCQEEIDILGRLKLQPVVGNFGERGLALIYSLPEESKEFYGIAGLKRL